MGMWICLNLTICLSCKRSVQSVPSLELGVVKFTYGFIDAVRYLL